MCKKNKLLYYIGCSFKFIPKIGVEESIVNAPLVSLHTKNTNNAKSEVTFTINFNAYFEEKFK
jgi:hypothetical protein